MQKVISGCIRSIIVGLSASIIVGLSAGQCRVIIAIVDALSKHTDVPHWAQFFHSKVHWTPKWLESVYEYDT